MVYYSHEESITFAGEKIIKYIENSIDDFEKILWNNFAMRK